MFFLLPLIFIYLFQDYGNKVFYDNSKSADYEKDIISDDQQERTIDVGTASLWGKLGFDTLSVSMCSSIDLFF